jgi:hypothetical protein
LAASPNGYQVEACSFLGRRLDQGRVKIDPPRPLNDGEHAVLSFLLGPEFNGVKELRAQVIGARVIGKCDCGCPTVDIEVDANAPSSALIGPLAPVEVQVSPVGNEPAGEIILFLKNGRLDSMEYVYYSDRPPTHWPALDHLSIVQTER